MRHAKAERLGPTDFERNLARRGRADAAAAGEWLAGQGITPDHALVSAAARTVQTWSSVAEAAGWDLGATYDKGLYLAGSETALDLMRETPVDARTLLLIGHNPTVADLAQLLDNGEGDAQAGNRMAMGYPTGAMAVLAYDGEWVDLAGQCARVTDFRVARA